MNNEAYQIKNAVKQITGHELDTILVLGANKQAELKSLYWWLDLANNTFAQRMGWA